MAMDLLRILRRAIGSSLPWAGGLLTMGLAMGLPKNPKKSKKIDFLSILTIWRTPGLKIQKNVDFFGKNATFWPRPPRLARAGPLVAGISTFSNRRFCPPPFPHFWPFRASISRAPRDLPFEGAGFRAKFRPESGGPGPKSRDGG